MKNPTCPACRAALAAAWTRCGVCGHLKPLSKMPLLHFTLPPAMLPNALRDALHAHHLPCVVSIPSGGTLAKIKPGNGISPEAVRAFVQGFIAGFRA